MADDGAEHTIRSAPLRDLFLTRRTLLGAVAAAPLLSLADTAAHAAITAGPAPGFASVAATVADAVTVPEGYEARTLVAWGDALFENMAPFNPDALTRAEQEKRFGQNNDMLAIFPGEYAFPWPRNQKRHVMCANNEYFDPSLTFPAVQSPRDFDAPKIEAMYASMGVSVITVDKGDAGDWKLVRDAAPGAGRNRRVTPFTPVAFSGPAKNHPWIASAGAIVNARETHDVAGAIACGTMANCAGGYTPWGTYLTAEENFNSYFYNSNPDSDALKAQTRDGAYALDAGNFGFPAMTGSPRPGAPPQFDISQNPTGPALYGWIVEIDPYDPNWTPKKRTALGRRKSECATSALTKDGRVAIYSGDDQIDEYVYKFISRGRFNPANRIANRDLLDDGRLYAARMDEDGTGTWLPLTVQGANRAARAAGYPHLFKDEGDLLVRAREAARLLGATPMDRPEDVEAILDPQWKGLGPVLIVCTNNAQQGFAHPGNPRREDPTKPNAAQSNRCGHIVRLDETNNDCGSLTFKWDIFLMGGDPAAENPIAMNQAGLRTHVSNKLDGVPTTSGARFACPDNICVDTGYNVWIATDGSDQVFGDCNDSVLVTPLVGDGPRPMKRFLVGPMGAEICGPLMAPDEKAFFCAIQHPGENNAAGVSFSELRWKGEKPPSTFPDGGWPRSAVVYVTKKDGGKVGT